MLLFLALGGSILAGSVRFIPQENQALVETSGIYKGKKLDAGLKFIIPFVDRIADQETIGEKVLDIPPQLSMY